MKDIRLEVVAMFIGKASKSDLSGDGIAQILASAEEISQYIEYGLAGQPDLQTLPMKLPLKTKPSKSPKK
jgi:hypothetical protein